MEVLLCNDYRKNVFNIQKEKPNTGQENLDYASEQMLLRDVI